MIFGKQIAFIEKLKKEIHNQLKLTIEFNGSFIVQKIKEEQLFKKGEDGNEKKLKGYSRFTIRYKLAKGQPTDRTTTRDTEKFHNSITIDATPQYFLVSSNVPYDKWIVKQYGKDILKVNNDNLREFLIKFYLPNLKRYVNNKIKR